MSERKIILVTGGNGMSGHALQDLVRNEKDNNEEWHFVDIEDADLLDNTATLRLFEKIQPTHVIHLAAAVGGLFYNHQRPLSMFRENILINDNVLYACYQVGVRKVVSAMTAAVQAPGTPHQLDEAKIHVGLPHGEMLGYSVSKRMIDILNRIYNGLGNHIFTAVVPTNLFGPHDNFNLKDGHVLANIIHKTYKAKKDGTPLTLFGTGIARRRFMFSYDFARLLIWAIREYGDREPIILAPDEDEQTSIREMASVVTKVMGFNGETCYDSTKSDGNLNVTMCNAKLRKHLPEFKFTPFEEAVKKTADWFEANLDIARV